MISGKVIFDGVILQVPIISGFRWNDWAEKTCEKYPTYCGAGKGIGDLIVPDKLLGLRVSVACHIHDVSWAVAEATDEARNIADKMFLDNMQAIIKAKPGTWWQRAIRHMMAMGYYVAVNSTKNHLFFDLKREQQA